MKVICELNEKQETILNISVFNENDIQFILTKVKFKDKIIKIIENIILPDELFLKIKDFEENKILYMIY